MASYLKSAKKATGTAEIAIAAGDAAKARRALAFAGSSVGLVGCPRVADLSLALALVCAAYSAAVDQTNADRRVLGRGPVLGLAL